MQQIAQKIWIETSSISPQLLVETSNADWSILVYVWLFRPFDRLRCVEIETVVTCYSFSTF